MDINKQISLELSLKKEQVDSVITLFSEGATIPFIARYRKERTGGLDEDNLREIEDRLNYLTLLNDRKATILASITEQGKLTPELESQINQCIKLQELEDLYLPYKPKRKTRGTIAKAKGLEPLAQFILDNPAFSGDFEAKLKEFISEELGVLTTKDALQGAGDIIAEMISENPEIRKEVRSFLNEKSVVCSAKAKEDTAAASANLKLKSKGEKDVYLIYYDFKIDILRIKPYQTLAMNRGEEEKFLKISLDFDREQVLAMVYSGFFGKKKTVFEEFLKNTSEDAFDRLIFPSIEREVRNTLTETAELHAIEIFANNLRSLLLQPPVANNIIMGLDPGFASGTKVAVIDETGKYLAGETIYPHPPMSRTESAEKITKNLIEKYNVGIIAIGNGTASRETELFISDIIKKHSLKCKYIIVNEAGASVYSASETAKIEFPELEASQRGNISIARRLLDPLAELVKIDPKSIGVGLYQHDVNQKNLTKKLDDVVISCVNYVGVDINTASAPLLSYVSGLNKRLANNVVKYREEKGRFKSRAELMKISGFGEKVFEQSAGFLKISDGDNPLDNTFIHPESYDSVNELFKLLNVEAASIREAGGLFESMVAKKGVRQVAEKINVGEPTLQDILDQLKKPGRDPRSELPPPILRSDVLKMEDLQEGMKLKGTVRNVVDFGAFVDIGVKQDGLLHVSQMRNSFVKNPLDVLAAGDIIEVTIIGIDKERGRISLSLRN